MAQSHWGRPAPDYFSAYSLATATRTPPPNELEEFVLNGQALDAIRRIYLLSNKKEGPEIDIDSLASQIPLSWLTTILDATRSPSSFILLTGDMVITVCIELMSAIKHCGKSSPFSYEYGYVCFRIITVAIGANILHRAEVLKNIAGDMDSKPNAICLEVFSERISQFVLGAIHAQEGQSYCDFILGWAPRSNQECKEPLIDQSDALLLLNLFYVDRKAFLESLYSTHSPGLSGVYFLLWRYYKTKCPEKEKREYNCPSESQTTPALCELIWRYFLISPAIHDWVMTGIFNDIGTHTMYHEWKPGFVDTDDAQTIVRIFVDRLLAQDAPPAVRIFSFTAGRLVAFVRHYVEFGAVDLIPLLLRNVVRNEWYMMINGRDYESPDETVEGTEMILSQLA